MAADVVATTPSGVDIVAFIVTAFWIVLIVAITVRIILAVARRRARSLKNTVIRPILDSAAVESKAYGWAPAADDHGEATMDESSSTGFSAAARSRASESDD